MQRTFVFGAREYAGAVIDTIEKQGLYEIAFLVDDDLSLKGRKVYGYRVLGGKRELTEALFCSVTKGVVAISNNAARVKSARWLLHSGFELVTVVHPSAELSRGVSIARGAVVHACVVIRSDAKIGENVILGPTAKIGHNSVIGDGVRIGPGCLICGNVTIGANSFLGAATSVIPGINIGKNVTVGSGSTVVRDIPDGARVGGSPCRPVSYFKPRSILQTYSPLRLEEG